MPFAAVFLPAQVRSKIGTVLREHSHLSLASLTLSPNCLTCSVLPMCSFLILSILVTPTENLDLFNSVSWSHYPPPNLFLSLGSQTNMKADTGCTKKMNLLEAFNAKSFGRTHRTSSSVKLCRKHNRTSLLDNTIPSCFSIVFCQMYSF